MLKGLLLALLALSAASCGKKSGDSGNASAEPPQLITADSEFISKQLVVCDDNKACPKYVAKIVITSDSEVRYCSGTLIDDRTVVTSASCLPLFIRQSGRSCKNEIHFFFKDDRQTKYVGCDEIIKASELIGNDPVQWREDVAFLRLSEGQRGRARRFISREGVPDSRDLTLVGVEKLDSFTGVIRTVTCETIHNTYINPHSSSATSPNLMMAGCAFKPGFLGAALQDNNGRVRAISSLGLNPKMKTDLEGSDLMVRPLRDMIHASNFACAETHLSSEVSDEVECRKDMSDIDGLRSRMMEPTALFEFPLRVLNDSLNAASKYIHLESRLIPEGKKFRLQVVPVCFKNVSSWLPALSSKNHETDFVIIPEKLFSRRIDAFGRTTPAEETIGRFGNYLQFFPKTLKNSKISGVYKWKGEERATFFKDLPYCP